MQESCYADLRSQFPPTPPLSVAPGRTGYTMSSRPSVEADWPQISGANHHSALPSTARWYLAEPLRYRRTPSVGTSGRVCGSLA